MPSARKEPEEEPVEQARSRRAEGSVEPGSADGRREAARVPTQLRPGDEVRERGIAGGPARGEPHGEPPIPRPRVREEEAAGTPLSPQGGRPVIQRASVRGQILDAL